MRNLLWLELKYGGWPQNRRGIPLIPKRTGHSGIHEVVEMGGGWATYHGRSQNHQESLMQQSDLFDG